MAIDTSFDFRSDANGDDPDKSSLTLRRYHGLLWRKPLPSGVQFELDDTTPGGYLHHRSELGDCFLSSDSVMPTFTRWESVRPIVDQLPAAHREAFVALAYTIGGMTVFPASRIDGKWTINQARGMNRAKIADRFRSDTGVHPQALPRPSQPARRHVGALRPLLRVVRRLARICGLLPAPGPR